MNNSLTKVMIPVVGLAVAIVALAVAYFVISAWWSQPPPILGFSQGPTQPIAFMHSVHVGQDAIDCQFCHRTVATDEAAGIPPVSQCMFCHDFGRIDGSQLSAEGITADEARAEVQKLRDAYYGATDANGQQIAPPSPINWQRVYRMPDHVQFVHSPHIQAGVSCSQCHGDVSKMQVVEQATSLKMRMCVDCHRQNNAPTDCTTCHY
ncbi:MAG: hypothetical protein FJ318_07200 [SAR202 cluster bacterium]|nr:hypothetical protein [SAR202 cluster bacterium]